MDGVPLPRSLDQLAVDARSLTFYINILFLAVLSAFILVNLPRAFARVSQANEWCRGFSLRSTRLGRPSPPSTPQNMQVKAGVGNDGSDDSHIFDSQASQMEQKSNSYPLHVPACPAFARPLAWLLSIRLSPGFSLGQILILGFYMGILVYGGFHNSNPVTDPVRTGWIAVSQLPIVCALATKNNLIGLTVGLGYEKVSRSSSRDQAAKLTQFWAVKLYTPFRRSTRDYCGQSARS